MTKEDFFNATCARKIQEAKLPNTGQWITYNNTGEICLDGEFSLEELRVITSALEETRNWQPEDPSSESRKGF